METNFSLYHYTNSESIESIKRKGLLNIFGLIFFTKDNSRVEPSVDFSYLKKMSVVEVSITDEFEKVSELIITDYELMCSYFNPRLIHLTGSNIDNWYVIRRDILISEILSIKDC